MDDKNMQFIFKLEHVMKKEVPHFSSTLVINDVLAKDVALIQGDDCQIKVTGLRGSINCRDSQLLLWT